MYAHEAQQLVQQAARAIEQLQSDAPTQDIHQLLQNAQQLNQMQLLHQPNDNLARQIKSDIKATITRLKNHEKKNRLLTPMPSIDTLREDLVAPRPSQSAETTAMVQKSTAQRVETSTQKVIQATKATVDIENTGNNIMDDLARQRETMLRSRSALQVSSQKLDESGRILRNMARRAAANKWILRAMVILIVGALLLVSLS